MVSRCINTLNVLVIVLSVSEQLLTIYRFLGKNFFIAFMGSDNFFNFLIFFFNYVIFKFGVHHPPRGRPGVGTRNLCEVPRVGPF